MFSTLPPATRAIIVANAVVFPPRQAGGNTIAQRCALWPLGIPLFKPWQLLTYAFLHGGFAHIFFNMFALFMFGRALEEYWGSRRFMTYYMASVLAAGATQLAVQHGTGPPYETIGASGGIFGILLAFAMFFPRQRIILLFPPIPLPAWLFVTVYGLLELFFGVTGRQQGVAHFAHLGGMLGGALCLRYWRGAGAVRS